MGRFLGRAGVLLAAALLGPDLQAQQPTPMSPYASTSLQPPPCVCPPPPCTPAPAPCFQPGGANDRQPPFAIDLMFGQESGVRGQFALFRDSQEAFVIEGFYGALFHNLGSSEALGAGARYLFRERWPDGFNSLTLGPGVDVFFQLNHNGLILLTPSVDLAWVHALGAGIEWEVGLDAGLGVGVAGRTKNGNPGAGKITPLLSLFTGFRF